MKQGSEKEFIKILMMAYTAGYEKGTGKDIDFSRWWLSKKDLIEDYFVKASIDLINEIKDEYNSGKTS